MAEMKELLDNCIITEDGSGHLFTSKINGNSIFLRENDYWTREYVPSEDDTYRYFYGTSYYLETLREDVPTIKTEEGLDDSRLIRPVRINNAAQ